MMPRTAQEWMPNVLSTKQKSNSAQASRERDVEKPSNPGICMKRLSAKQKPLGPANRLYRICSNRALTLTILAFARAHCASLPGYESAIPGAVSEGLVQ